LLADLDELVMTCSDPRSKAYLKESVQCYKAGAYRSSVVACWIAVAFDLVDKIRELAALGDKQAQEQINRFDRIHANNDIPGALAFEKELPAMALNKFEFVSHLEHLDLIRLVEDRNRCAHPSQVSEDQVFEASAELARLHISNSVRSILSQRATQSKASLSRLMGEMESRYFPTKSTDVYKFLMAGPLGKPTKSLYRNFLHVLVIALTRHEITLNRNRASNALVAAKKMHPELWQEVFPAVAQKLVAAVVLEEDLATTTDFLIFPKDVNTWSYLSELDRLKFTNYISNAPASLLGELEYMLDLPHDHPLYVSAKARMDKATLEELKSIAWPFFIPAEAFLRTLKIYSQAKSFAAANEIGKIIRGQMTELYKPERFLKDFLKIAKSNDQILSSNEFPNVLKSFASVKSIGLDQVLELLEELGLSVDIT
jgi:hypothetical protein